ncbi:MAG: acyl--CoA ligase, partial [Clostridiales bacterium]|nr:acyl--CoA ligase [Clostridiales bacterium]
LGADGKLHLAGREGGVLCVGGFMVSLDELERIARSMDGVEDCACVAVDDDLLGQIPALYYAAPEGSGVGPQELRAFLEAKLERFKLPRRIERLERIPKLYNGKTDVRALRG